MFTLNFSRILGLFLLFYTFRAEVATTSLPTCTAPTGEETSGACKNGSTELGSTVCITSTEALYTSTEGSCAVIELEANKYYIFKSTDSNGNYSRVDASSITTNDSLLIYSTNANKALSQKTDFTYLDDTNKKLIICASTGICTLQSTNDDYYINDILKSSVTDSPLIELKTGKAIKIEVTNNSVYSVYFDSNNNDKIIKCTTTSCEFKAVTDGQIFVNAAVTSSLSDALIFCKVETTVTQQPRTSSGSRKRDTVTCSLIAGEDNGYYLNAGPDSSSLPLIVCSNDTKCTAQKGSSGTYYPNANVSGEVIECSSDTICRKKVVAEGNIFLNSAVSTVDNGIIQCGGANDGNGAKKREGNQATAITCSIVSSPTGYYLNSGIYKGSKPLIVCGSNKCEEKAGISGKYYLNANEDGKVIECTSTNACANKVTAVNDVFLNSDSAITSLTSAIIKCEGPKIETSGIVTMEGRGMKKRTTATCNKADGKEGDYYLNAGKNKTSQPLIVCVNSKCEEKEGVAGAHYLNANEAGKVIECTKSSSCVNKDVVDGDIFVNSVVTTGKDNALISCKTSGEGEAVNCELLSGPGSGGYYINAGVHKTSKPLIVCSAEGCKEQEGATGTYYLNANEERKGEVIECSSSSSCSKKVVAEGEVYLNSAKDAASSLKSIIQCSKKTQGRRSGDSSATASEITCSKPTAPPTGYYLNSGMNKRNKPLVVCTTDGGCDEKAGGTGTHYINANTKGEEITKVIECTSSSACSNKDVAEKDVYLNDEVTDGLVGAIIQCTASSGRRRGGSDASASAITCTSTDACTSTDDGVTEGYYLNAGYNKKNKPLIKCTDSKCEEKAGVTGAHYLNVNEDGKVIECTTNTSCSNKDVTETDIYLNSAVTGELKEAIIQCSKEGSNAGRSEEGNNDDASTETVINCRAITPDDKNDKSYYLNAGVKIKNKPLIVCTTEGGCKEQAGVTGAHYLNSNENEDGKVIECTSTTACSNKEAADKEVYLNSAVTGKLENAIIKCEETSKNTSDPRRNVDDSDATETEIKCTSEKAEDNQYYLNAGVNGKSKPLIICTEKGGCKEKIGVANAYYPNAGVSGKVIECSSSTACANRAVADEDTYLNYAALGSIDYAIIQCTKEEGDEEENESEDGPQTGDSDGTSTTETNINCEVVKKPVGYYLNSGLNKSNKPLIICGEKKCEEKAGVANAHYLNFLSGNENGRVIECTADSACSIKKNVEDGDVFINSAVTSALSDALIQCKAEENTRKRSEGGETDVTDDTEATVICDKMTGTELNVYINAGNKKQIIRCLSNGCEVASSDASSKNSSYYINEEDKIGGESLLNHLIKCTSNACTIVNELPKDEVQDDYKVFLNANYKIGIEEENPLIKCTPPSSSAAAADDDESEDIGSESETIAIDCSKAGSEADSGKPEFYVNGDRDESNKRYDGVLKNDVIKCEMNESTTSSAKNGNKKVSTLPVTCSTSSQTTKANDIFINANFELNKTKQIIKCTADQGCYEAPAFPTEEESDGDDQDTLEEREVESRDSSENIYYVNAGSVEKDKLQDTLIECSSPENACEIKPAEEGNVYINANDNQLILCYASKGCIAKVTDASRDNNEFYINSIDNDKDLANDLIKCYLSEDSNTVKTCELFNGEDKKVYINSFNPSQLIYCLSDSGCQVKNSTAVVDQPEYYVNGDDIDFNTTESDDAEENPEEQNNLTERNPTEQNPEEQNPEEQSSTNPTTTGATDKRPFTGDLIECKVNGSSTRCSIINGKLGEVYINSNYENDKTYPLIKCYETGCVNVEVSDEQELPQYYINSGNKAKNRLTKAIIECVDTENACEIIEAGANEVYINSNENETDKQIIKCTKNNCSSVASGASKNGNEYYIDAGRAIEGVSDHNVIFCSEDSLTGLSGIGGESSEPTDTGVDSLSKRGGSVIVTCARKSTDEIGEGTFLNSNYSEIGDKNQLIQCSSENGCKAISVTENGLGYYVNGDSIGLKDAIIYCSSRKCEKQTPEKTNMYFVGKDYGNVDGLIECVEPDLMEVTEAEEVVAIEENINEVSFVDINEARGRRRRRRSTSESEGKCTLIHAFTSEGYYLNSGYDKSMNPTIQCDFNEGCKTLKVELGYYINAGNPEKPVIKCEKEGSECEEEEPKECPEPAKAYAGDYCYEDFQLKFFTANNTTAIAVSKSNDVYAFATIPSYGFPGIKVETGTLFKITRFFITRFYKGGVVMIDKSGKLVDTLGGNMSDIFIYDCNETTKVCTKRPGCTSNTYMFDSENSKAVFCKDGNLEYAEFTGYVVDGNHVGNGNKHPYIIHCENGKKCTSFKPKIASYYINSGYDASPNILIQCSHNNCETVTAEVGYYVAHSDEDRNGVIRCITDKSCMYNQVNSSVKYLNSGYDRKSNGLIECKDGKCKVAKARKGYYLTYISTRLIYCQSSTSCEEITPAVNYYDNADSSEGDSTIINCTQTTTDVTCAAEATNEGFYMSSESNVLIRCKEGEKCKSIVVFNGIFRGALKGLTSNENKKRSENVQNVQNLREHDFDEDEDVDVDVDVNVDDDNIPENLKERKDEKEKEMEKKEEKNEKMINLSNIEGDDVEKKKLYLEEKEIEKMVNMSGLVKDENVREDLEEEKEEEKDGEMVNLNDRGSSEEGYGIIRCIGGKCSALSMNELNAIPVCEFNHNKCYITQEYAMKKVATTTLTAGNICTNLDRSVFYFATDTIVVKPNVISGVIATYVYTTTNANCVEVNDSYTNMFFPVGSTIYTLDQGSVFEFQEIGYYFIDVAKNTLVASKDINEYNDENVKLYRCDGNKCNIVDKQNEITYFADVSKRILRYDTVNDRYSFAYEKDILCIFAGGKCTPNEDLKKREFCITYKGEIVLAATDIKNRETGECYRAGSINSNIYGYSSNLYRMNEFAAQIVHRPGFYIISRITNTTVVTKDYTRKKSNIVVYGCTSTSCQVYEPEEDTYYYDAQAKVILKYGNGVWSPPSHSGYAYVAVDPSHTYIYRFTKKGDQYTIQGKANYGYYYTVDNKMYHCDQRYEECYPIEDTDYYFTNTGEIYYCIHDSEGLEPTECIRKNCVPGEYYYINENYYRCEIISGILVPVASRYCYYNGYVIMNFPVALTEEFPYPIQQAVNNIQKNNNSTAVIKRRKKNELEVVSGIFTNCTYDAEETKSNFDLVCINNYVIVDKETNEMKICNLEQFGYVDCVEDDENPSKCNVSAAYPLLKPSIFTFIILLFITAIFHF